MDITWREILAALGGTAGVLVIVGFFGRSIFLHVLSKDIEAHKSRLQLEGQQQLAFLRGSLERTAMEHEVRFTQLHSKRGEVIAELYYKLAAFHAAGLQFASRIQAAGSPSKEEQLDKLADAATEYQAYFNTHRIYFSEDTCNLLLELDQKMTVAANKLATHFSIPEEKRDYRRMANDWNDCWNAYSGEIPPIREELEHEFREILGVEVGG